MKVNKMRIAIILVWVLSFASSSFCKNEAGLIYSGLDTLASGIYDRGIDFILQRPCSLTESSCYDHFDFSWEGDFVLFINGQGLIKDYGKTNFDST